MKKYFVSFCLDSIFYNFFTFYMKIAPPKGKIDILHNVSFGSENDETF